MSEKKERVTAVTPNGIAAYPWITKADTKFNDAGVFKTNLILSAEDESVQRIMETIDKVASAARDRAFNEAMDKAKSPAQGKKVREKFATYHLPYEDEYDDDGNETGNVIFKFKANASGTDKKTGETYQRKIPLFDAHGKRITGKPPVIGGGSEIAVSFSVVGYGNTNIGAGATLYMDAVQVVNPVSGGGRDASEYGFGSQDGYEYEEEAEEETSPFADGDDDEDAGAF